MMCYDLLKALKNLVWGLNLLDGRKHSQEKIFMENVINERNVRVRNKSKRMIPKEK